MFRRQQTMKLTPEQKADVLDYMESGGFRGRLDWDSKVTLHTPEGERTHTVRHWWYLLRATREAHRNQPQRQ